MLQMCQAATKARAASEGGARCQCRSPFLLALKAKASLLACVFTERRR